MKNSDDTIEARLGNLFDETREGLRRRCAECESQVRRSPAQALLLAAGFGYITSKLPLTRIVGVATRLIFSLIRPAVVLFLGAKIYDLVKEKRRKSDFAPPVTIEDEAPL